MHADRDIQARQVWPTIDQTDRQQVVEQFRQTIQEMIDEHFRISTATPLGPTCEDLCAAIQPQPSPDQQGEPTDAVRAA